MIASTFHFSWKRTSKYAACETNMPSGDNHLVVNLIMIELMGTIFFLAIVTICIYIKRYFVRKSLAGFKALVSYRIFRFHLDFHFIFLLFFFIFLIWFSLVCFIEKITNGDTNLSQELAEQLSSKHNCHVILVKGREAQNDVVQTDFISSKSAGISVLHCDILNNDDLEKLSQTLQSTFDGIDIVIDNATKGVFSTAKSDDCRAFVDVTSEKLRTTINVSGIHFEQIRRFY